VPALAIVTTPGSAIANSYASEAEAATTAGELFPVAADAWTPSQVEDRRRALVTAARRLDDRLRFLGVRVDNTQALEWPRSGVRQPGRTVDFAVTEIPAALKTAQIRLAIWLLEQGTENPDDGWDAGGLSSVSFGSELSMAFEGGASGRSTLDQFLDAVIRPILGGLVYAGAQPHIVRG
jgi:hypothetical protein